MVTKYALFNWYFFQKLFLSVSTTILILQVLSLFFELFGTGGGFNARLANLVKPSLAHVNILYTYSFKTYNDTICTKGKIWKIVTRV